MDIQFSNGLVSLNFVVEEEKILLKTLAFNGVSFLGSEKGVANSYVHLSGGDYRGHFFGGYAKVSEQLKYDTHKIVESGDEKQLIIVEKNENISVKTVYSVKRGLPVFEVYKEVTNVSGEEQVVESAMPICLVDIMRDVKNQDYDVDETEEMECGSSSFVRDQGGVGKRAPDLWRAYNPWCGECAFEKLDMDKEGLRKFYKHNKSTGLSVTSNGSSTTCKYLPLGILKKEPFGCLMFEIFNDGSWSYSLQQPTGDDKIALCIGKNLYENGWYKILNAGEVFSTERVRFSGAKNVEEILEYFTEARRRAIRKSGFVASDYVIYNNFMHNTYDHPTEEIDRKNIEEAKKYGADYFVIDAGWHDDNLEQISPTQKIGEWTENTISYPSGLNKTLDFIRENGMKPGLWVEVQSVGVYCKNKNLLPDECFFNIRGKRLAGNRRYQLNFAFEKVRDFATEIIDGMVQRYNPEYIKIDYNQMQYGTETAGGSLTEGLREHFVGYLKWFEEIQQKYPNILFESCASGGMNMAPAIAEKTTVFSVSDLSRFKLYPYMIANAPFAALPEQCGIWCMPVRKVIDGKMVPLSGLKSTDEEVIMNVINSLYMVMHLGSKLEYLNESQEKLLKEGIEYYRKLSAIKKKAVPIMPNGFPLFGEDIVYVAMRHEKKIYLSVYNLSDRDITIAKDFSAYKVAKAKLAYPMNAMNDYNIWNGVFQCKLKAGTARAFELS